MKRAVILCVFVLMTAGGCGFNHLRNAQDKYKELEKLYRAKSVEEVDIYEPRKVNVGALMDTISGRAEGMRMTGEAEYDAPPRRIKERTFDTFKLYKDVQLSEQEEDLYRGHVMFIAGRWKYDFQKPVGQWDPDPNDREYHKPYKARVIATYLHIYYEPVSAKEVKKAEKDTGKPYDPTKLIVRNSRPVKMKEIRFEYNENKRDWEQVDEKVTWDIEKEK